MIVTSVDLSDRNKDQTLKYYNFISASRGKHAADFRPIPVYVYTESGEGNVYKFEYKKDPIVNSQ